jgi:hypothetical protein
VDAITTAIELTEAERLDRLRLIRSDNVGAARYYGANATSYISPSVDGGRC